MELNGLFDDNRTPDIPENVSLDDLVGEGKKYKTTEEAAKALLHKDLHISRLETENKTFRDELKVRTTLEEFMEKMKESKPDDSNRNTNTGEEHQEGTLTKEQLEALISETLDKRTSKSKADGNVQLVQNKLQEAFGVNWQHELQTRTGKLGLGKEFVTRLAAEQPQAVLKLLDVTPSKTIDTPSLFSRVTATTSTSGTKNNAHYRKLMRDNPKLYWKAETQTEMFKQLAEQGDAFYAS